MPNYKDIRSAFKKVGGNENERNDDMDDISFIASAIKELFRPRNLDRPRGIGEHPHQTLLQHVAEGHIKTQDDRRLAPGAWMTHNPTMFSAITPGYQRVFREFLSGLAKEAGRNFEGQSTVGRGQDLRTISIPFNTAAMNRAIQRHGLDRSIKELQGKTSENTRGIGKQRELQNLNISLRRVQNADNDFYRIDSIFPNFRYI